MHPWTPVPRVVLLVLVLLNIPADVHLKISPWYSDVHTFTPVPRVALLHFHLLNTRPDSTLLRLFPAPLQAPAELHRLTARDFQCPAQPGRVTTTALEAPARPDRVTAKASKVRTVRLFECRNRPILIAWPSL
jgi:hypothetical protein